MWDHQHPKSEFCVDFKRFWDLLQRSFHAWYPCVWWSSERAATSSTCGPSFSCMKASRRWGLTANLVNKQQRWRMTSSGVLVTEVWMWGLWKCETNMSQKACVSNQGETKAPFRVSHRVVQGLDLRRLQQIPRNLWPKIAGCGSHDPVMILMLSVSGVPCPREMNARTTLGLAQSSSHSAFLFYLVRTWARPDFR